MRGRGHVRDILWGIRIYFPAADMRLLSAILATGTGLACARAPASVVRPDLPRTTTDSAEAKRPVAKARGERLPRELASAVLIVAENDDFDFSRLPSQRSDDNYTQGARVASDLAGVPAAARHFICRQRA